MLYGQKIFVYCDNLNVTNIHNTKCKPLHKMHMRINEYAPEIKHIDGSQNGVADYLSRLYGDDPVVEVFASDEFPLSVKYISEKQQSDSCLIKFITALETGDLTILNNKEKKTIPHLDIQKCIASGCLLQVANKNQFWIGFTRTACTQGESWMIKIMEKNL